LQDEYRSTLKGFYGALKSMDAHIEFAILTGVTKVCKASLDCDLNNLFDISMDERFVDICGITDQEIDTVFSPYVQRLANAERMLQAEVRDKLRLMYGGFHFCEDTIDIYNPFSLLCTFKMCEFKSYWFEPDTPSYLVKKFRKHQTGLAEIAVAASTNKLPYWDSASANLIPLMYQSGYLTIKSYQPDVDTYQLGFPNEEVKTGFDSFMKVLHHAEY
jgi:hypothetical protein